MGFMSMVNGPDLAREHGSGPLAGPRGAGGAGGAGAGLRASPEGLPRPGRRRSEEARQAILAAALELNAESGYARLTVDAIAARSGTGRQTIYRWWPTKDDVLMEAGAAKADLHVPIPDHGSYQADLHAFLTASFRLAQVPQLADVLRALMARAQIDAEFGQRFRAVFLQRRRAALGIILDRAAARGELPAGVAQGTIADVVFGVIWYRLLATGQPLDDQLADQLTYLLASPSPA
jgi:AcrR family transcriptional regulator